MVMTDIKEESSITTSVGTLNYENKCLHLHKKNQELKQYILFLENENEFFKIGSHNNIMNIVYNHSYGNEDLLGAHITIYKHKNTDNKYTINAEFSSFYTEHIPILKTTYNVILCKEAQTEDEEEMIIKKYTITILAHDNPPPEELFYLL